MQIGPGSSPRRHSPPWPTWIALAALWCAVLVNQAWIYAFLFLAWSAYDLVTGASIFVQRITRRDQPATYWVIVSTWVVLGVLMLLSEVPQG